MEGALVPLSVNQLFITHAEYQGCFIKIWANFYSRKQSDFEKRIQDYNNFTKELQKLDLNRNSLYVYTWKVDSEIRVYRCQVLSSNLIEKTHKIILVDYGRTMVVSFCDVREVTVNVDLSLLIGLSQRSTINTFLLSGYLGKSKSNNDLIRILCNKYYKYRRDFEVGGVSFVSLYGVDKSLIDQGAASTIDIATMVTIANNMTSTIILMNKNDVVHSIPNPSKAPTPCSFLKSQVLDCINLVDVAVTRVTTSDNTILLTVRTIDNESEILNNILNTINRQSLKMAPVLEVYSPCLIVFCNKLVRAIILEVEIDKLYIDLVDFGRKEFVPRSSVFEIPPNCKLFEMRSLNVVVDKPNNITIDKISFIQNYYKMLPLKMDPNYGLYKVKLFKKQNDVLIDVCNSSINDSVDNSILDKSSHFFSITEINDDVKSIENTSSISCESFKNLYNDQIVTEKINENLKDEENFQFNQIIPIMFLKKENLDVQEIVGSLICYNSPYSFYVRQYDSNFVPFMDKIKSNLDSRNVLIKSELVKNMYVIYQNRSNSVYRAQVTDMDSEVKKINLRLVDKGDEMVHENFDEVILYNFIESDCALPEQLVLECSLSNMWFPLMTVDITLILLPYFNKELLYKIKIVKSEESGVKVVQMINKDTNIDISDSILESGIGQRLCVAMKTDEIPYEENLLIGQNFLSYVYFSQFKVFIQPEPNTVDEMEEEILKFIKSNSNHKPLDINNLQDTYCLATVNNHQWYRAYIYSINGDTALVNMFDIGLLNDIPLNQIQSIPNNLMRKPQLCLPCTLETDLEIKISEKKLYCVTVKSINNNGTLCITVKEHHTSPLFSPIVRGIENISSVYIDGDWTYLQRHQDVLKAEKISETLSQLNSKLENNNSSMTIIPGDMYAFKSHEKYYRCLVKSIQSEMTVVHCIDFGFEKQVEKKKLICLKHSKSALLPALAIAVKTFPMTFNMSKSMFLANLFLNNNGLPIFMPNNTRSILSHNKLKEALENGCLVKVTCVYSSDDCWIVPKLFFDTLETISKILLKMQSKVIPEETKVGSLCAALHSKTKIWHRALILNEDRDTENMLAIDSGERFKALKCTKMVSEIQKIPNCALRCQVISNVDVMTLQGKNLNGKLISCLKPLLEVELFTVDTSKTGVTSVETFLEWKVIVQRFESFNEFYVKKINERYCLDNENSNHLVTKKDNASDDKVLPEKMAYNKLYYRCCLMDEIEDNNLIDPKNLPAISELMMSYEWIMKTSSDREPYKVFLTADSENCIDIVYKFLYSHNRQVTEHSDLSIKETKTMTSIKSGANSLSLPEVKTVTTKHLEQIKEMRTVKSFKSDENSLSLPEVETVTIKHIETFQDFYVQSNSLSTLYLQRINSELDMCIVELPIDHNLSGSIVVTSSNSLNVWCRVKVDEVESHNSAYCYLLDYGIYEECFLFYKPTNFLCICPPLVRRCMLHTPKLKGKESEIWYPDINDMFKDISTIDIEFQMSVKEEGDPCTVILWIDDECVSDMLFPIFVQLTYINSLTDFKAEALSLKQKAAVELLRSGNVPMVPVENPIVDHLYLTKVNTKPIRVKLISLGGIKYVVKDIDDTLDTLSVCQLYEVPEAIRDCPIFTLHCSFIFNKEDENIFLLDLFQKLANSKVTFIMCVITESNDIDKSPNLVRLYLDNKNVLDLIKKT